MDFYLEKGLEMKQKIILLLFALCSVLILAMTPRGDPARPRTRETATMSRGSVTYPTAAPRKGNIVYPTATPGKGNITYPTATPGRGNIVYPTATP
jgi:hypothetical protein